MQTRKVEEIMLSIVSMVIRISILVFTANIAAAQIYPERPIRVLAAEVGGGADFIVRIISQGISGTLGQQMVIDNRPGSPIIPAQIAAKARSDGYTLLFYGNQVWLLPFLQEAPYDPVADFAPISLVVKAPNLVVVHPSAAANSIKELIALAKASPGAINYGSGPNGSSNHLAAELFKFMAGVNITRITYQGTAPALNGVLGGHVQLMFSTTAGGWAHVKSGKLRALAVTSAEPTVLAPGLPTVAASGLPGYESTAVFGFFAPAGTPDIPIRRLNTEIVQFLGKTDVKEKFLGAGVEAVGTSPAQLAAAMKSDMARMSKVIANAGMREAPAK
jgi:tripartite-type tricarboxylate transporter receptor subunit TctC